ncbi:MAG: peptidase [Actinomycetia bacterium]|nr:peptidase [Actinomycetes bacterium]
MANVREIRASQEGRRLSPVFLVIVAACVLTGLITWRYGRLADHLTARIALFGFVVSAWIMSLCLHEFAHAYFAFRAGDRSIPGKGYLTLNPLKYADPILSIGIPVFFMLLGGIGLPGGAVWIDRGAIQGKVRHSLISAAGPLANVAIAIVLALILKTVAPPLDAATVTHGVFWSGVYFLAFLQITAALLNLLPIPGLDGFGIVEPYLPRDWVRAAGQYGQFIFLGLIALLWYQPVNSAFYRLVFHITDTLGVNQVWIGTGLQLFRFWSKWPPG